MTMIIRLCYGKRVQASLKLIACISIAILYFGFLFRESLNAFEQNKDKAEAAAVAVGLIQSDKLEVSSLGICIIMYGYLILFYLPTSMKLAETFIWPS